MAFRRKDVKKASYYVWFLGAKESAGLRGEQYIMPALGQLFRQERMREPCKVTLQVSSKGLKIVQNVCRSRDSKPALVKHVIPASSITCAMQSEDVVCVILLLYNPMTGCPVHVHAYRCDSLHTAFGLRTQLQTLIERPENQRKFSEIEARLAAKGLLCDPQMTKHVRGSTLPNSIGTNSNSSGANTNGSGANGSGRPSTSNSTDERLPVLLSDKTRNTSLSNHHTLNSDGRSAGEDSSEDCAYSGSDSNSASPEDRSATGLSSASNELNTHLHNPIVAVMYESLAAELKAKLGNPEVAPILLPPRDYDTVCRKQGRLLELQQRKCTNQLLVGAASASGTSSNASSPSKETNISRQATLSADSLKKNKDAKETSLQKIPVLPAAVVKPIRTSEPTAGDKNKIFVAQTPKQKEPIKPPRGRSAANLINTTAKTKVMSTPEQVAGCDELVQPTDQTVKSTPKYASSNNPTTVQSSIAPAVQTVQQINSIVQAESQLRLERLRVEKLKIAAQLEQLEQMEQLERATAETARKHAEDKLSKKNNSKQQCNDVGRSITKSADKLSKENKSKQEKANDKQQPTVQMNPKLITQHGLVKQIGNSLANKIRHTLFVASGGSSGLNGKQSPQLIRHQMLHSSQPDLRLSVETQRVEASSGNLAQPKAKSNDKRSTLEPTTTVSVAKNENKSSLVANRAFDQQLLPLDGKRSSASSGQSASSGIGSSRMLMNSFEDELGFGSTDEELELEMLRHSGSGAESKEMIQTYGANKKIEEITEQRRIGDKKAKELKKSDHNISGKWHSRSAALDSLKAATQESRGRRSSSSGDCFVDDGLVYEEDEDEYFINDELELDERPMMQGCNSSDEEAAANAICYDENLMPKIHSMLLRPRAASVESRVPEASCKRSPAPKSSAHKSKERQFPQPVSRQACLRRSETCVGSSNILSSIATSSSTGQHVKRGQSSACLKQPPMIQVSSLQQQTHSNYVPSVATSGFFGKNYTKTSKNVPKTNNKNCQSSFSFTNSTAAESARMFYFPHVPNDHSSSSSRRTAELRRQASTPALNAATGYGAYLHSNAIARPFSGAYAENVRVAGQQRNSSMQVMAALPQPFRLRNKPLPGYIIP